MESVMPQRGSWVYFVGIKGTGMCALAELMHNKGMRVSGSDTAEVFYTDSILKSLGIPYHESFDASHVFSVDGNDEKTPDLVVHSAAYSVETNAELAKVSQLGIPLYKYTDALGAYSLDFDSSGITGVHGKTTTTALTGALIKGALLPAQVLAGSAVSAFRSADTSGDRSTLCLGGKYFVAETCEYRRHFLSFHPRRIVLTSVESDHQDYYPTYESIRDAFVEYGTLLPSGGELIYCADDPGASEVARIVHKTKPDLRLTPYGFSAQGDFGITHYEVKDERIILRLRFSPDDLSIRIPGRHTALNAAAAMALTSSLVRKEFGSASNSGWNDARWNGALSALQAFSGSRRRSEILGEAGGILFMDDYAHHPTAIKTTLSGIKEFYPNRRLVVSFMSHTYTRTASLLDEFAASFDCADVLVLHKIYSSAREAYSGGVTGKTLFDNVKARYKNSDPGKLLYYAEEVADAVELVKPILKAGDLFITMGAGDNWRLGSILYDYYSTQGTKQ